MATGAEPGTLGTPGSMGPEPGSSATRRPLKRQLLLSIQLRTGDCEQINYYLGPKLTLLNKKKEAQLSLNLGTNYSNRELIKGN